MWDLEEWIKTFAIVIIITFAILLIWSKGYETGYKAPLEEMNKYGNIRIDGKVYVIEEVISDDNNRMP